MTAATGGTRSTLAQALFWLSRLIAAFLIVAAVLVAGYAPYTGAMLAVLGIAGLLLAGAAAAWLIGPLVRRLLAPRG